ncbi:MAG TPA: thiamine pyrophosphate-binding protein [Stellaceae bacterium]|nr:thiamine pyrophosphate-binding protein [Stellaceae bacterium]
MRPGIGQPADRARQRLSRFGAVSRGDRQHPDRPVQPGRLPGALPPLPGRFPVDRPQPVQARLPADARRPGAADGAAGVEDDGHRPAGSGRARHAVRHLQGGGRRDPRPARVERQHLVPLRGRSGGRRRRRRHAARRRAPGNHRRPGRALRRAAAELLRLAERLQVPVGASASGLGAIDTHHPLSLGLVSRGGLYQANAAMRESDVLLALGVRFDDRTSSSWIPGYSFTIPPTRLIHVDIDPDEIGRNYPVALGLMADVRAFLRQLLAEIERRDPPRTTPARQAWLARIDGWRGEWQAATAPGYVDDATPINPQRAAAEIDKALPEDAILVSDIGVHHNWLLQFCRPTRPDSLIGCMGFGPMGFGVAGVLGARLAAPDRPCVSVCGDGAFFMHASVLGTAVEYGIPAVWVVWNNYSFASIRGLQRGYLGGRELATDFRHPETGEPYNPDFAALARACGVDGVRIDRAGDLGDAIKAAIATGKPYLIDANIGADLNPGGAGVWELPGHGISRPFIGGRYEPGG